MMRCVLFDSLEFQNFRCYDVPEIGPFRGFNLIYGRNGSGKSALLEAIEISLTGRTSRLPPGEDWVKAVARNKRQPIRITLKKGNTGLYTFDSARKRSFNSKKILSALYNIYADGKKAKGLLSDKFETHNILYPERIVQFLEANKKDKLKDVLNESVAGRETMGEWSKIDEARKCISRLLNESDQANINLSAELQDLRQQLGDLEAEDTEDLTSHWEKLRLRVPRVLLPPELEHFEGPELVFMEHLNGLLARLRYVRNLCEEIEVASGILADRSHSTLKNILDRIQEGQKQLADRNERIARLEKDIQSNRREIEEKQRKQRGTNNDLKKLQREVEELTDFRKIVWTVKNWLPELTTAKLSETLENESRDTKNKIRRIKEALQKRDSLPNPSEITETIGKNKEISQELSTMMRKQTEIRGVIQKDIERLSAVEGDFKRAQTLEEHASRTLNEMYARLDELVKLVPGNQCPACGTMFNSPEELLGAIKSARKAADELISISKDQDLIDLKLSLEREVSLHRGEDEALKSSISQFETKLWDTAQEIARYEERIKDAEDAIRSAGIDFPERVWQSLATHLEAVLGLDFSIPIRDLENQRERLSKELDMIWNGLRRDDFIAKRYEIEEALVTVNELGTRYSFPQPSKLVESSYESLLNMIEKKSFEVSNEISVLINALQIAENEIKKLHQESELKTEEVEQDIRDVARLQSLNDQFAILKAKIERLVGLGLLTADEHVLYLGSIQTNLNDTIPAIEAFGKVFAQHVANGRLKEHLKNKLEELKNKINKVGRSQMKLRECQERLGAVQSPEQYTGQILKRYEKTINSFLSSLHWPRDFFDVRIEAENGFEITMSNVISPEDRRPAHHKLSAGQRAALAVSVFWTLNTAFTNVPEIILMDEPVQNIDEMNILNFLDGLRWFVESVKRQVFLTTASQRIQALIKKKFAYLKEDFLEVRLQRDYDCTKIRYFDWNDNEMGNYYGTASGQEKGQLS